MAAAAVVGLGELALSGCTTAFDHHYLVPRGDDRVFDVAVEAARSVGVRLHVSRGSMDLGESHGGLPPDHVVEDIDAILASTERIVHEHHDGETVSVVVAPCSPFSVTPELMRESATLARRHGLRLHTHLAETVEENAYCLEHLGRRPLDLMEEWGWLADDVWFAHGVHFADDEVRRIGAAGAGVAHCPSSNARLAAGIARVTDLEAAGAPVGLGVDGVASNEVGRLFPELRQSLYAARLRGPRADVFMPRMRSASPPRVALAASAAKTSAGWWWVPVPTWPSGRGTTSPTSPTRSTRSCSDRTGWSVTCWWGARPWSATGSWSGLTCPTYDVTWRIVPSDFGLDRCVRTTVRVPPRATSDTRRGWAWILTG